MTEAVAVLVKEIMAAHLANPNCKIDSKIIPDMIKDIYSEMMKIHGDVDEPASLPKADSVLALPQPTMGALEPFKGSTIRVAKNPRAGRHVARAIWPGQPDELLAKFEDIMQVQAIPRDNRGMPIQAKTNLLTPDRMKVLDPISGKYYSMLKHHLRSAYGLSHAELLIMFKLTPEQLPETAPQYSLTKSRAAKIMGLGKSHRKNVEKAG